MQWERPHHLFAARALTAQGWQEGVLVEIDRAGLIAGVKAETHPPDRALCFDLLLPGMSNVHSHAFQRAIAGLAESAAASGKDNFWTWREAMYGVALRISPEQHEAIAHYLYIELLKQGYTSVGEFHYLHHDVDGRPYSNLSELSDRVISAAQDAGIHLTHLPVMYETANFGAEPPSIQQRRFVSDIDGYLTLVETLKQRYSNRPDLVLGVAPHSLRAVTPQSLQAILDALPGLGMQRCPIHIHAAEQEKEVADSIAWSGQRPVEWLLDHAPVNQQWCLIHATHMTPQETERLAASNTVAGLCPSTEANLGDGVFPAQSYLRAQGRFAIGSDSHICVSPWEELRLMEYAQRLALRKRAILHDEATPSVGRTLFSRALAGGAQAMGIRAGQIAVGFRADLMALSMNEPLLAAKEGDRILDTLIFALPRAPVTDVFVAGRRVVKEANHAIEEKSAALFRKVMQQLGK